jgi:uncharacterized membrane protein YczE
MVVLNLPTPSSISSVKELIEIFICILGAFNAGKIGIGPLTLTCKAIFHNFS